MLTVCIQAGGASSRMGEDKALKPFLGRPLIQRVVDRLSPIADEMIVTTNHPEDYRFLNVRLTPDLKPGRGALGGLYTAVASATHPLVAVVACDMPFASPTLLEAGGRLMVQEEADVVIAKSEEGYEPIHAVYRRATCLPAIEVSHRRRPVEGHRLVSTGQGSCSNIRRMEAIRPGRPCLLEC